MASAGRFRFWVLVGLRRLPLHGRSTAVAQAVLGPCCAHLAEARLRDIPDDDDREYFITAWCLHPRFIKNEEIVYILEPILPGFNEANRTELPGLRYLVRIRLVAYQDWHTPPPSPPADDNNDTTGDGGGAPGSDDDGDNQDGGGGGNARDDGHYSSG